MLKNPRFGFFYWRNIRFIVGHTKRLSWNNVSQTHHQNPGFLNSELWLLVSKMIIETQSKTIAGHLRSQHWRDASYDMPNALWQDFAAVLQLRIIVRSCSKDLQKIFTAREGCNLTSTKLEGLITDDVCIIQTKRANYIWSPGKPLLGWSRNALPTKSGVD